MIDDTPILPVWWKSTPEIPTTEKLSFQVDVWMRNLVRNWRDDRRVEEINRRACVVLKGGLESCR